MTSHAACSGIILPLLCRPWYNLFFLARLNSKACTGSDSKVTKVQMCQKMHLSHQQYCTKTSSNFNWNKPQLHLLIHYLLHTITILHTSYILYFRCIAFVVMLNFKLDLNLEMRFWRVRMYSSCIEIKNYFYTSTCDHKKQIELRKTSLTFRGPLLCFHTSRSQTLDL